MDSDVNKQIFSNLQAFWSWNGFQVFVYAAPSLSSASKSGAVFARAQEVLAKNWITKLWWRRWVVVSENQVCCQHTFCQSGRGGRTVCRMGVHFSFTFNGIQDARIVDQGALRYTRGCERKTSRKRKSNTVEYVRQKQHALNRKKSLFLLILNVNGQPNGFHHNRTHSSDSRKKPTPLSWSYRLSDWPTDPPVVLVK